MDDIPPDPVVVEVDAPAAPPAPVVVAVAVALDPVWAGPVVWSPVDEHAATTRTTAILTCATLRSSHSRYGRQLAPELQIHGEGHRRGVFPWQDLAVVRSDLSQSRWYEAMGTATSGLGCGLGVGPSGAVHLAASTIAGGVDFAGEPIMPAEPFVVLVDVDGTPLWSRSISAPGRGTQASVAVDGSGSVFVGVGSCGVPVAQFDALGNLLWWWALAGEGGLTYQGGLENGMNQSLSVMEDGGVVFVGGFAGTLHLGSAVLTATSKSDLVVFKLGSDGDLLWAKQFAGSPSTVWGSAESVAVDSTGALYVLGYSYGPGHSRGSRSTPTTASS